MIKAILHSIVVFGISEPCRRQSEPCKRQSSMCCKEIAWRVAHWNLRNTLLPGAKSSGEPKKKISLHNLKTEKIPKLPKNKLMHRKSTEKKIVHSERIKEKYWIIISQEKQFLAQPQGGKKIHASHKASSYLLTRENKTVKAVSNLALHLPL